MLLRGKVFSGALRGAPLIEKYHARLIGLIGYKPFFGTLNVELDKQFDLKAFAKKRIEHVLRSGKKNTDAYLAPGTIRKASKMYPIMEMRDREADLLEKLKTLRSRAKEIDVETKEVSEGYDCWVIQFTGELADLHVVEIIAKDELRKELGLSDEDVVEIVIK